MKVLPIVERELRVASRRPGTYWWRVVSSGLALSLFGVVFLENWGRTPGEQGKMLFETMSWCFLGVCLLVGVVYTADSLSEEKREGTLGLLFLTNLRGYDVVLGKLVASSMGAAYGVFAMVPVLGFPLLLGGVERWEWVRVVLVLLNALFLSLAVGMLASAAVRETVWAMGATLGAVLVLNLGGPVLVLYWEWMHGMGMGEAQGVLFTSVFGALSLAEDALYARESGWYWMSMIWTHVLGWVSLLFAGMWVRRGWQDTGRGGAGERGRWLRRVLAGDGRRLDLWRGEVLDASPCAWLTVRHVLKPRLVWVFLLVAGLGWLSGAARWGEDWVTGGYSWFLLAMVCHTVLRCWMAVESSQLLGSGRRSGALELVLTTPLGVREVVRGHLVGLQRVFFGPVMAVMAVELVLGALAARREAGGGGQEMMLMVVVAAGGFVLDMVALAYLGLWNGLVQGQVRWALLRTLGWVLVLPWVLMFGMMLAMSLSAVGLSPRLGFGFYLGLYVVTGGGVSAWAILRSRRRLLESLAEVVASVDGAKVHSVKVHSVKEAGAT